MVKIFGNNLRLAIFDLDGTLIEFHREYLFSQTDEILPRMGHSVIAREELELSFSLFDYFRFFADHLRDTLVEEFWEHFNWECFPKPELISGVLDTLDALLTHKVKVAIATSRFISEVDLREVIKDTGLLKYMSLIRTRHEDHIHWSDKRGHLVDVCKALQIPPNASMMVGDIPPDMTSATEVGISSRVAVLSGGIREDVLLGANPSAVLTSVKEIKELLAK